MIDAQTNISKTKTRVLNIILILVGGALFLVLLLRSYRIPYVIPNEILSYDAVVSIGNNVIPVTIADSPEERSLGLSKTKSLASGTGKLFIFDESGYHSFWMKDMLYSIDIIWIDSEFRIIKILKSVSPETYPEIFTPTKESMYVLEVPAGFSTENNISENQLIKIHSELVF